MNRGQDLLVRFSRDFLGLDRNDAVYRLDGTTEQRRRVYLDSAATSLMAGVVWDGMRAYLERSSANSHTEAHRAGRDTTLAIEESRDLVGRLVGYDPSTDVVLFTANGATGAINFLARAMFPPEIRPLLKRFPQGPPSEVVAAMRRATGERGAAAIDSLFDRPLVITSRMEHHSNLLPWMEAVGHHNVRAVGVDPKDGTLDLDSLRRLLDADGRRTRLVAITGTSNVTGVVNPIPEIARLAHSVGAELMVDGAQWVPHSPVAMHASVPSASVDYLVLSGHKMYAPGSRGALIGKLATLTDARCVTDVGGGMAEYVSLEDFEVKDQVTAREEAGTPNIPGSVAMGLVAETLMRIGMEHIAAAEHQLTGKLLQRLGDIDGVRIYGNPDTEAVPRAGVVAFDVEQLDHRLVAAYLNDFHNIAVRDGCFCAHPYVKELVGVTKAADRQFHDDLMRGDRSRLPGMVRASLGVYSTEEDVDALGAALDELLANRQKISALYRPDRTGTFFLRAYPALAHVFRVTDSVAEWEGAAVGAARGRGPTPL